MSEEQSELAELVQERVEAKTVNRAVSMAYREVDVTGIMSNSYTFVIDGRDSPNELVVNEGDVPLRNPTDEALERAEAKHDDNSTSEITVTFDKFMTEYVPCEPNDGLDDIGETFARSLDIEAFGEIDNSPEIDVTSMWNVNECIAMFKEDVNRRPDVLVVAEDVPEGAGYDNIELFIDDMESLHGIDCYVDENDVLPSKRVIVCDRSKFGYEMTRTPIDTREYLDEDAGPVVRIYCRTVFQSINPEVCKQFEVKE